MDYCTKWADDAIRLKLIPSLTGHSSCSALEREVLSLPCRLGGLDIVNPVHIAGSQFTASTKITASLQSLILDQAVQAPLPDVHFIKAQVHQDRRCASKVRASEIRSDLSAQFQRVMDLNSEPGASSWLTALPLAEQGFHLNYVSFNTGSTRTSGIKLHHKTAHTNTAMNCHAADGPPPQVVRPDHVRLLQMVRPAAAGPPQ